MAILKDLLVNGVSRFIGKVFINDSHITTINDVAVTQTPKFTDTVTTATTSGSGNAVTAVTASNGALTVTKGTTFLTSHQDISGKADKSATVSTVAWDSTNKKLTKTINGTTSDVVTAATLRTGLNVADGAEVNQNAFSNVTVGSTTIAADSKTDTLTLVAGSNVTLTPDATNDKVTIAATDTTYSEGAGINLINGAFSADYANIWSHISQDYLEEDLTKLSGIDEGAEVNQNAFSNIVVGSTTIAADAKTDTLTLVAGSNVTLTPDATNDKVTIAATNTTYESKAAASGGTAVSLVTTGEKYTWNQKTTNTGTVTKVTAGAGLSGGDITTTGTIAHSNSVTAQTTQAIYPIKIDAQGHISAYGTAVTPLTSHQTIKQDGITGATVNRFGTCSTAAATAAKTVSITTGTFSLETGAKVTVKFTNKNTANSPTLNVNSTGAKNIFHNGAQITSSSNKSMLYGTVEFIYDGTQWQLIGNYVNTDTIVVPATGIPAMDGTGAVGTVARYAREDHVHPTDTSRAPTNHASSATTYGIGTASNYGHVKISDSYSATGAAASGLVPSQKALSDGLATKADVSATAISDITYSTTTATKGSISGAEAIRMGAMVQARITITLSATAAAGTTICVGTITGLPAPPYTVRAVANNGENVLVMTLTSAGELTAIAIVGTIPKTGIAGVFNYLTNN